MDDSLAVLDLILEGGGVVAVPAIPGVINLDLRPFAILVLTGLSADSKVR